MLKNVYYTVSIIKFTFPTVGVYDLQALENMSQMNFGRVF